MNCTIIRRILVTHGSMDMATGAYTEGAKEWETRPCDGHLSSPVEKMAGVCASCARGWKCDTNYAVYPLKERTAAKMREEYVVRASAAYGMTRREALLSWVRLKHEAAEQAEQERRQARRGEKP